MNFKEFLHISEMLDDLSEKCLENIVEGILDEEFEQLNEASSQELADKNDAKWITSNGKHYCIDKKGTIVSGKFKGTNMKDLKATASSKLKTKFNNVKHDAKKIGKAIIDHSVVGTVLKNAKKKGEILKAREEKRLADKAAGKESLTTKAVKAAGKVLKKGIEKNPARIIAKGIKKGWEKNSKPRLSSKVD